MNRVALFADAPSRARRILMLGAHCDDIEIGCGGTILKLCAEHPDLEVTWAVFCSTPQRSLEARASAAAFLEGVKYSRVIIKTHRDGFLPHAGPALKEEFESLKSEVTPDLIFTHYRDDQHQDHREISALTWNTWRNQLILEYEIPKYDGDFGAPNVFSHLPEATADRKISLVLEHFRSQVKKHWLTADLLKAVARIRGMESVAPEHLAEGFYSRKLVF